MEFKLGRNRAAARTAAAIGVAGGFLSACGGDDFMATNNLPTGVTQQSITVYSATTPASGTTAATQDLLTAGLGKTGLASAVAPAYADPLNPTALELRRNAFHSNYRGLVDPSAGGGFGTLYGPNVDVNGVAAGEGMIPGREYIGTLDDGSGKKRVTIAVQIPDSFNQAAPCLVLGPSSGSRGVYGALATASDWGLKHGCAVALTDAGKGIGLYDMMDDTVNRIDGHARQPRHRRRAEQLRRRCHRRGAGDLQRAVCEPARIEAGALATQSREGLGHRHARRGALRVLRVERSLRGAAERDAVQCRQYLGDRRLRFERRRCGPARGRAGHGRPDRRRRWPPSP